MLKIRLQRMGKKKFPTYRFVVSEHALDTQADYVEKIGSYNPHDKESGLQVNKERAEYWLKQGAQPSNTVHNLFIKLGLIDEGKKKSISISKKRSKKIEDKKAKEEEERKAAEEAKKAQEAEKAEEETEEKKEESVSSEKKEEEAPNEDPKEEKEDKQEDNK